MPSITPATSSNQSFGTAEQSAVSNVVLSFDVEEHFRIESATGISVEPELQAEYTGRVATSTQWILDAMAAHGALGTFFILGVVARDNPQLIRSIHQAGHEIASHGWDHRRVCTMTPKEFQVDLRKSKVALEQITGEQIKGYRAPTFSIGSKNPWAIDVLAVEGFVYDSSIYPVRHDRYGVPSAPRQPFLVHGEKNSLIELPPATLRVLGMNIPMGGGGYFRLFPLGFTKLAIRQSMKSNDPGMLYFHPWEFDPEQPRLPLKGLNRQRTYVGLNRNRARFENLLTRCRSSRACDVVDRINVRSKSVAEFHLADFTV